MPIELNLLQNRGMTHRFLKFLLVPAALSLNLLGAGPASAGLGDDAASVLSDTYALQGTLHITLLLQYDLHEITTDSGMRIREFVNRSGTVFAVTWSGPVMPDLQQLLGANFAAYVNAVAASQQTGLRRSLRIATSDLVVESAGHMRAYQGRAYLPALVPSGTNVSELR